MLNTKPSPVTVGVNEGHGMSVMGGIYRVLISGKETGGAFAVIDMLI